MVGHPTANGGLIVAVSVVEIGGSHVTAAVVDPATWTVDVRRRTSLDAHGNAAELLGRLAEAARVLPGPKLTFALPGPFDYAEGTAWYRGVGKFEALYGVRLREHLATTLGTAGANLDFLNDADAFALGEWTAGGLRSTSTAVGITLGTGVGSAFLRDGRIVRTGPGVPPQGEIHLREPFIEDEMSHRAIIRRYAREAGAAGDLDVRTIAERARTGESAAVETLNAAFRALAKALTPCLEQFGAEALVLGGSISGAFDLAHETFAATLGLPHVSVSTAADTERSALIGAAADQLGRA